MLLPIEGRKPAKEGGESRADNKAQGRIGGRVYAAKCKARTFSKICRNSGSGARHIVLYVARKGSHDFPGFAGRFAVEPLRLEIAGVPSANLIWSSQPRTGHCRSPRSSWAVTNYLGLTETLLMRFVAFAGNFIRVASRQHS
jgi:hypothetical protein